MTRRATCDEGAHKKYFTFGPYYYVSYHLTVDIMHTVVL